MLRAIDAAAREAEPRTAPTQMAPPPAVTKQAKAFTSAAMSFILEIGILTDENGAEIDVTAPEAEAAAMAALATSRQ